MAFAIVLWTEDLYSVASASQVHYAGEVFKGLDAMVDQEEGKKGRKTGKKIPYPAKIIKTGGWQFFNCFNVTFQFNYTLMIVQKTE